MPESDIPSEKPLTPGMQARADQTESDWGKYVDAIGFFYNRLRQWNIREEFAIQLAARFQAHLETMLEADAAEKFMQNMEEHHERLQASKATE